MCFRTKLYWSKYDHPPDLPTMFYFNSYSVLAQSPESLLPSAMITFYYYVPSEIASSVYMNVNIIDDLLCEWILLLGVWTSRCGRLHFLFMRSNSTEVTLLDVDQINPFKRYYICISTHFNNI